MPLRSHELVKLGKKRECVSYKGLRYGDRPRKRVALSEIAANHGSESSRHDSIYGCKQCDVYLCKERGCFDVFHRGK
jgi:hypothetical protein